MKHSLPSLDALKVFESAARHLSFSLAAEELCLSKGAVSHHLRRLERQVGSTLFRRAVRQVYLTEAGQRLFMSTQRMFKELGDTLDQLKEDNNAQTVTIAVTTYVAVRWLSAQISEFNQSHPNVSIALQHTVNSTKFNIQDVDIALRWSSCNGKIEGARVAELAMPMFPVCSPKLLGKLGYSADKELKRNALTTSPCNTVVLLCEERTQDLWSEWYGDTTLNNPRRIVSDSNVRVQAAIDGQGFMLADNLMMRELKNGWLVAPFSHQLTGYGYTLLSAPSRISSDNATDLRKWLAQRLKRDPE